MELCGIFAIETATDIKSVSDKSGLRAVRGVECCGCSFGARLLLLLAGALYLVFGRKEESKARPAAQITITTATAQKGNIGVYLEAIGTVTPVYTASIFSQVTGVVFAVNYQEGQLVKKGDPIDGHR